MLPNLQEQILLKIVSSGSDVTVNKIQEAMSKDAKKEYAFGSIFTSLDRLSAKKFVEWKMGEKNDYRGGRAPRLYNITPAGRKILSDSLAAKREKYNSINSENILDGALPNM